MTSRSMYLGAAGIRARATVQTLADYGEKAGGSFNGHRRMVELITDLHHLCAETGQDWTAVMADSDQLFSREQDAA